MKSVFCKSGVMGSTIEYAPPAFSIFHIGVTQASISFKSSAEFETHAIDSFTILS